MGIYIAAKGQKIGKKVKMSIWTPFEESDYTPVLHRRYLAIR